MSDFDCGCGCGEDDPICKCNGGPGYDNLGGSRRTYKRRQNSRQPKNFISKKFAQLDDLTQVVLLFLLDGFLFFIAFVLAMA